MHHVHLPRRPADLASIAAALGLLGLIAAGATSFIRPAHATQPGYTVSTVPAAPGRAGRLAEFNGSVWVYEQDRGEWIEALRNRPLTSGDRVSTGNDARAEIRVGSTTLRLAARSEIEVVTLDDHRLSLQLHTGSVALRLRTRDWAEQIDISTPEVRLKPTQAGHYRIDRFDDQSFAGAWRGELLVDEAVSFPIGAGQRMEFWRERGLRQHRWSALPSDALQAWAVAEDQREERTAFSRHVSPEMTGAEELDRHGRWEPVPEYGAIWFPLQVSIGWAPYLFGNWVWVRHWGWVWVDKQPWGFAPFHYGRWVQWRGRWGWVPGAYAPRPIFAPVPRPPHEGRPHPPPPRSGWQPGHPHHPHNPHHPARPPDVRPPHRPEPGATLPAPRPAPPWATPREREHEPRGDRWERGERGERDRGDRGERGERGERGDRPHGDRHPRNDRERPMPTPQPVTVPSQNLLPPAVVAPPPAPPPMMRPPPPRNSDVRPPEPVAKREAPSRPEPADEGRKRIPERGERGDRADRAERAPYR